MPAFICTACGTQFPPSDQPPDACRICTEERQYVLPRGQTWTTLDRLRIDYFNAFREYEAGVIGIGTQPNFAIGQRAILIRTPQGNVLWDCIAFIDQATISIVNALGGLSAIAISHPHFYTTMAEWSAAFGGVPVYLHGDDREWVMRPHPKIVFWEGDTTSVLPGVTLIRCGGHFRGGNVLHWSGGAEGRGVLCSADIATVTLDRKFLTFMRSYPNFIPLPASEVRAIGAALAPFPFETIYGHYFDRVIPSNAKEILNASVERYVHAIGAG